MSFMFHGNKDTEGVLITPMAFFANKSCITIKLAAAQSICLKIMLQNSTMNYVMELHTVCFRFHITSDDYDIKISIPVGNYHIAIVASHNQHLALLGGTMAYVQIDEVWVTHEEFDGKHFLVQS